MPQETLDELLRDIMRQRREEKLDALREVHPKADKMVDALIDMYRYPAGIDMDSVEQAADLIVSNIIDGYQASAELQAQGGGAFDPWGLVEFDEQGRLLDGRGQPIARFDPRALRQGQLTVINPLGTYEVPLEEEQPSIPIRYDPDAQGQEGHGIQQGTKAGTTIEI